MTEKLVAKLKQLNVGISTKGNVCLNDFVVNVLKSTNPDLYMKKITDKKKFGDKFYIEPKKALELVKNGKVVECKQLIKFIETDQNDHTSLIDPKNNMIKFNGHRFVSFFVDDPNNPDNWNIWIQGSDVASFLQYTDCDQAIKINVSDKNKISFEKLFELFRPLLKTGSKSTDNKAIFININGFFELTNKSKKDFAVKLRYWVNNEVLPSLVKTGSYHMQPLTLNIKKFYDNASITQFFNVAVMYIAYIGFHYNQHIFKYGLSRNMFRRDYKEHRKNFDQFDVVFIGECDNCEQVEKLFETEVMVSNLHRSFAVNGKNQTELFTVTTKHTYDYFIDFMKKLIVTHKLPAIAEANNQITTLSAVVNQYDTAEKTRQMELQFKMSDNYKLELERDIRLRELDLQIEQQRTITESKKVAAEEKRTEAERERTKQASVNKNFNYVSSSDNIIKNPVVVPPKLKKTYNKKNVIRL